MVATAQTVPKSHKVRTLFAGLTGTIAVSLILLSIMVIWLNRTLTDTTTYVNTVAPLVTKPVIQNFIAQKVSDQILTSVSPLDLAQALLPANQLTNASVDPQLVSELQAIINTDVLRIVGSTSFAALWKDTNRTVHASLASQLAAGNSDTIVLDLTPTITGVVDQLKTTQLQPVAEHMDIPAGAGKISISDSKIVKYHQYYQWFQEGTVAIVIVAVLFLVLAVRLSMYHSKTLRRVLVGVGTVVLLQALILWLPSVAPLPVPDKATLDLARAIEAVIFHNLFIASLAVGVLCITLAIGSKLYEVIIARR